MSFLNKMKEKAEEIKNVAQVKADEAKTRAFDAAKKTQNLAAKKREQEKSKTEAVMAKKENTAKGSSLKEEIAFIVDSAKVLTTTSSELSKQAKLIADKVQQLERKASQLELSQVAVTATKDKD